MSVYAILLCGGSGTRMGARENKTLLPVGGVPACVRAGRTLLAVADGLVAVVRDGKLTCSAPFLSRRACLSVRWSPAAARGRRPSARGCPPSRMTAPRC